jgi:phosphoenolpyruvate---glycerone phosphotransferase subunit DhaL
VSTDVQALREVIRAVGAALRRDEQYLCDLDAAVGDGDHGLTMVRCWELVEREAGREDATTSVTDVLERAGRAVIAGGGGATGPLLGTALVAAGRADATAAATPSDRVAGAFEAAAAEVARRGHAVEGDRTMLDALWPAVRAARGAADAGAGLVGTVSDAAEEAERAASATADMMPRVGRATRLGARALGHPDPGAVSVAIVLRAAADCLRERAEREVVG